MVGVGGTLARGEVLGGRGGFKKTKRPVEEGGCQFGLVGKGGPPPESCGYRRGSWCLANKPWIPAFPSPPNAPAVSFLFILWWEVGGPAGNEII